MKNYVPLIRPNDMNVSNDLDGPMSKLYDGPVPLRQLIDEYVSGYNLSQTIKDTRDEFYSKCQSRGNSSQCSLAARVLEQRLNLKKFQLERDAIEAPLQPGIKKSMDDLAAQRAKIKELEGRIKELENSLVNAGVIERPVTSSGIQNTIENYVESFGFDMETLGAIFSFILGLLFSFFLIYLYYAVPLVKGGVDKFFGILIGPEGLIKIKPESKM